MRSTFCAATSAWRIMRGCTLSLMRATMSPAPPRRKPIGLYTPRIRRRHHHDVLARGFEEKLRRWHDGCPPDESDAEIFARRCAADTAVLRGAVAARVEEFRRCAEGRLEAHERRLRAAFLGQAQGAAEPAADWGVGLQERLAAESQASLAAGL